MKKISIFTIIILTAILVLGGCSPQSPVDETPLSDPIEETSEPLEEVENEELVLSLEELAQFDGQDGNRAYVAVDGIIYDVTDSAPWKNGKHNGFAAGNDLTREIKEVSPHGISKLANVVQVGRLAE